MIKIALCEIQIVQYLFSANELVEGEQGTTHSKTPAVLQGAELGPTVLTDP
jgi:hypothetical protein